MVVHLALDAHLSLTDPSTLRVNPLVPSSSTSTSCSSE
jgi:hypothetical protein